MKTIQNTIGMFFLALILISAMPISCLSNPVKGLDPIADAIQLQLKKYKHDLYYPNTVARFYHERGNRLTWVFPETVNSHGWEALLMLDCVVQFGLNHDDYHPGKLLSIEMHRLIRDYNSVSANDKAAFDVMLTDAIITFMNNLHYGKLNPVYNALIIDNQKFNGFSAGRVLHEALGQTDFMSAVLEVQPNTKAYRLLQSRMRLMTGQYVGDCYEVPKGELRKVAINMERLRWFVIGDENGININIPSATLTYRTPDTVFQFKVIVGKGRAIPILESKVRYFTFAANGGSPLLKLHLSKVNAYQKIDIGIIDGITLANLLLKNDGSKEKLEVNIDSERSILNRNFYLKNNLPIKISYLTCEAIDGLLVTYDDIYNLDKNLENALYSIHQY